MCTPAQLDAGPSLDVSEVIAAGTSAFEALQGKPPGILGDAAAMRKGAFRAQRTGEHTVAINLLLLSLQYEPLTPSEMADIGEALAKAGCVDVTAAQRTRLAVARSLANPKRLQRKGEPSGVRSVATEGGCAESWTGGRTGRAVGGRQRRDGRR